MYVKPQIIKRVESELTRLKAIEAAAKAFCDAVTQVQPVGTQLRLMRELQAAVADSQPVSTMEQTK